MKYDFNQLKEIVKSKMSSKRFTHTLGVVEMAVKLADIYKTDVEKCKLAALLHDISKEMDMEYIKNICKNNFLNELSDEDLENNEILHGFAGAYYVNKEFGIEDSEVLNLPVYGKASAGRGYLNMDSPDYYMPILRGNFSKKSFFVEITGNSMEPTLEDGQFALVDPDNTAYSKNKIYVVTYNDEGYIKRLEMKDKLRIITLKSDNPDYDDIDIPEETQEYFQINGRVVEVISKKKLL